MATQDSDLRPFSDIVSGFERALKLGSIAELGRVPTVSTIEVIACFADIRGFTKFVQESHNLANNLVADFLPRYFSIFSRAVLRETWNLEQDDAFQESIRKLIAPALVKKLGDGMLLVWETTDTRVKLGLRYAILDLVGYFQEYFYRLVDQINKEHGLPLPGMDLGIGLASGISWKLDYGSGQIDYAGRPLNIAARLQGRARPRGIYIDAYSFARNHLLERKCAGEGDTKTIEIDGVGALQVWFSDERTLRLRKPRKTQGTNPNQLQDLVDAVPYIERPREGSDETSRLPLGKDDTKTLLQIRQDVEAALAARAARRINTDPSQHEHLKQLIREMSSLIDVDPANRFRDVGQSFHEAIAQLSGSNSGEAEEYVALVHSLHYWTTRIYPPTESDRRQMVHEHQKIADAIEQGLPEVASKQMLEHLERHHSRVIDAAFGLA